MITIGLIKSFHCIFMPDIWHCAKFHVNILWNEEMIVHTYVVSVA